MTSIEVPARPELPAPAGGRPPAGARNYHRLPPARFHPPHPPRAVRFVVVARLSAGAAAAAATAAPEHRATLREVLHVRGRELHQRMLPYVATMPA